MHENMDLKLVFDVFLLGRFIQLTPGSLLTNFTFNLFLVSGRSVLVFDKIIYLEMMPIV